MRLSLVWKWLLLASLSIGVYAKTLESNSSENVVIGMGYVPYSYRISMIKKYDILPTAFEVDEYFASPLTLNSLYSDEYFEDINSSLPLINNILKFAGEIYSTNSEDENLSSNEDLNISVGSQAKPSLAKSDLNSSSQLKLSLKKTIQDNNSSQKIEDKNSSIATKPKIRLKEKILYIVKRGDSFIKLARDFNTTVFDIKRWNKIEKRDIVRLDEKLTIYPNRKTPYEKIKLIKKLKSYGRYKVQSGDTLSSIVRKFAVGKKETIRVNKLKSSNSIIVGQKLIIPLPQKKIDAILKKIEAKKRAKRLALERKKRLEMAKKGKYKLCQSSSSIFKFKRKIKVIATAYTSHRSQTDSTPFLAAWNNRIRPGMKVIAVSNDLIRRYGITNGTRVRISGLPGVYVVRDKMHPRLRNHIDIYMGTNISRALRWGRRRVILYW